MISLPTREVASALDDPRGVIIALVAVRRRLLAGRAGRLGGGPLGNDALDSRTLRRERLARMVDSRIRLAAELLVDSSPD